MGDSGKLSKKKRGGRDIGPEGDGAGSWRQGDGRKGEDEGGEGARYERVAWTSALDPGDGVFDRAGEGWR